MMNWLLAKKMARMGRKANPSPAFEKSLRVKLEAAGYLPHRSSLRLWIFRHMVAMGSVITMMAVGSTGAYAYASDDVLPDHLLYPVREAIEQIEDRAPIPVARVKERLRNHVAQRRAKEIQTMLKWNRPLKQKHLNFLKNHPALQNMMSPSSQATTVQPVISAPTTTEAADAPMQIRKQKKMEQKERRMEKRQEQIEKQQERLEKREQRLQPRPSETRKQKHVLPKRKD